METEIAGWISYSARVAAALVELNRAFPLDLIEFPEWGCEGYVFLLNRTPENYVPVVIHLHGPLIMFSHTLGWPEMDSEFYRVGTQMEETCLRLADAVFSSSDCSARWCAEHYGLCDEQITRLHLGVDIKTFHPGAAPKAKRPTIVFTGKIARNKGANLLVNAACQLVEEFPDLRLVIIGRGEREVLEELRGTVTHRGLDGLVELLGFVQREELPQHLAQAHVFAAPSTYEGGPGLVYLEAMACGLPVIGCQGSGAAEVIRSGRNGFLIPPQDKPALTARLRQLLIDPDLCGRMGRQAREFIVERADSEACVSRVEALYSEIVSKTLTRNRPQTTGFGGRGKLAADGDSDAARACDQSASG